MKKKLLLISMIITLLGVSLMACGKEEKTDSTGQEINNQSVVEENVTDNSNETTEEVEQDSEKTEVILEDTCRGYDGKFYIDVPAWQMVEGAGTYYYKYGNEKLIAVTFGFFDTATSAVEAKELAFKYCQRALENYVHPNSINITSDEEMTVNEWDVYRFEGLMNCGWEEETATEEFAVGYSFVAEEMPCMILGLVRDESQSQELCDEMESIIDAMINTLRTEK